MLRDQALVRLRVGDAELAAFFGLPVGANGIVAFAHGSGSSRLSARNQYVASVLRDAGLGTLLLDLLTSAEEEIDARTGKLRFDIELLARRVVGAVDWLAQDPEQAGHAIGLFGASTGAAAAIIAAAERPDAVRAVVSRGGRPDLAAEALARVCAPTLLIVGELDSHVIDLNRDAYAGLAGEKRLEIVPGATHLFEEPGTLEQVAKLARDWFVERLVAADGGAEV